MSTEQQTIPKKTRAKKGTKNWYFTSETEDSIVAYNETEDLVTRSKLYNSSIKPALEKLAENIIHTFKFYYMDGQSMADMQHEVVTFLVEKLPNYSADKGKAFSYFGMVAKNYCILNNNKNYKKLKENSRIDSLSEDTFNNTLAEDNTEDALPDFIDYLITYFDINLELVFPKRSDQAIVSAIVELFRRRENLEIFNKKALYIYIREMTNASTQQITKVVKLMYTKYAVMYSDYDRLGFIPNERIY